MAEWIAVTGGAGYIGSHIAAYIRENTDYKVLIIDRAANDFPHTHWLADELVADDVISDAAFFALSRNRPIATVHCAGTSLVGPSMTNPGDYYWNNVAKTIKLLDYMRYEGLNNLIFSSSAAVYGQTWATICVEGQDKNPINPYGRTKLMVETILNDYHAAYGMNSVKFRYFNAAGADPHARLGQTRGATHLVAKIMEALVGGPELTIYGDVYPTRDGTCIRDYVHVCDIARAHVLGIKHLLTNPGTHSYNLGSGEGVSVLEMIRTAEEVTGLRVPRHIGKEREGDPAILIADHAKVTAELKWQPRYTLGDIMEHAWNWYNSDTFASCGNCSG